jgi:hypothetical protein
MTKRVRLRVGEAKGRSPTAEQWISYCRDMVESQALRVLSRAAILLMHRLEKEHMDHGGAENGRLIVTHRQFEGWGVHRDSVGWRSARRPLSASWRLPATATRALEAMGRQTDFG